MKKLSWDRPDSPPKHPYRDAAILYAVFAGIIVAVTAISGGNLLPGGSARSGLVGALARAGAVVVAIVFFVVATGFSWWRLRVQERRAAKAAKEAPVGAAPPAEEAQEEQL